MTQTIGFSPTNLGAFALTFAIVMFARWVARKAGWHVPGSVTEDMGWRLAALAAGGLIGLVYGVVSQGDVQAEVAAGFAWGGGASIGLASVAPTAGSLLAALRAWGDLWAATHKSALGGANSTPGVAIVSDPVVKAFVESVAMNAVTERLVNSQRAAPVPARTSLVEGAGAALPVIPANVPSDTPEASSAPTAGPAAGDPAGMPPA